MILDPSDARCLIHTNPVVVISTINEKGKTDAMTAAWISSVSFNPPLIQVSISAKRYSLKNIKRNKEFVINIPSKEELSKVYYVGSVSFSEDENKVKDAGFTVSDGLELETPRLEEAIGWIECKVEDMVSEGDHVVVIGKIIAGEVKDELWKDRFLSEKGNLIHHLGKNIFLSNGEILKA